MTSTRPPGAYIYYGIVLALSAVAFLVFLFTIGGGRPSGPGLFLALSVLTLGVVAHLLFLSARALAQDEDPEEQDSATGLRRKELEREYQALKRALKELELDHAMGKLSDRDYDEIRGRYRERAVRVLRQLDQGESYKKQIEQDLKARREALAAQKAEKADKAGKAEGKGEGKAAARAEKAPVEKAPAAAAPASATSAPATAAQGPCPSCSAKNDADAAFCKKCGLRLDGQAAKD